MRALTSGLVAVWLCSCSLNPWGEDPGTTNADVAEGAPLPGGELEQPWVNPSQGEGNETAGSSASAGAPATSGGAPTSTGGSENLQDGSDKDDVTTGNPTGSAGGSQASAGAPPIGAGPSDMPVDGAPAPSEPTADAGVALAADAGTLLLPSQDAATAPAFP